MQERKHKSTLSSRTEYVCSKQRYRGPSHGCNVNYGWCCDRKREDERKRGEREERENECITERGWQLPVQDTCLPGPTIEETFPLTSTYPSAMSLVMGVDTRERFGSLEKYHFELVCSSHFIGFMHSFISHALDFFGICGECQSVWETEENPRNAEEGFLSVHGMDEWGCPWNGRNLRLGRVSSRKHIHISTKSTIPETCSMGGEIMGI
ncbi:hypothetical protein Taro_001464 [Colocasia esculenta]|uniref:Uncharacterized protein n=1 Tax=Colocasia esculenta TaxID=4460 RepID=A0A843TJ54_COLES|nr:hypothetical protein [Colocasia esculenta]